MQELPVYPRKDSKLRQIIPRFRAGNGEKRNKEKNWRREDARTYRIYQKEEETLEYIGVAERKGVCEI